MKTTLALILSAGLHLAFAQQPESAPRYSSDLEKVAVSEVQDSIGVTDTSSGQSGSGRVWKQRSHVLSITVNPIWTMIGAPDVSVEYRVSPTLGLLLNAMHGEFKIFPFIPDVRNTLQAYRFQVRGYYAGEGQHMAAEFSRWSITEPVNGGQDDDFVQWRVGLLVGHKFIVAPGLTLDMQGGGYFVPVQQDTDPENGFEFPKGGLILRSNLGWSF
jgi:hypothetical protein